MDPDPDSSCSASPAMPVQPLRALAAFAMPARFVIFRR